MRPEYDIKTIGNNLRRLREERKLSVYDVCSYVGYSSVQALYRVEAGKGWPQADSLIAIMELYEVYDIREITQKRNLKKAGREIEPSAPYSLCNSDGDKAIIEVEKANIKDPDWEIRVISRLKAFYDYFVGIKHCDAS